MKKSVAWLIVLAVIVFFGALYFTFAFSYSCNDSGCFQSHQVKCSRTVYLNDGEDATWRYKIKGFSDGRCKVNVELVQFKKGTIDLVKLEGNEMSCYLPKGSLISPESDLSACHGLLKEGLQDVIINKLHNYIVDNIGQVSDELRSI